MRTGFSLAIDLLASIRTNSANPRVIKAADDLEMLCRGYMLPTVPFQLGAIHLTELETRIMSLLHSKMGQDVHPDAILDAMSYDGTRDPVARDMYVQICHIRKKLRATKFRIEKSMGRCYRLVEIRTG